MKVFKSENPQSLSDNSMRVSNNRGNHNMSWNEYERRKQLIQQQNLPQIDYDKAIRALLKELRL